MYLDGQYSVCSGENQRMIKVLHYVAIMNRAGEETFIMNVFRKINRRSVMFDFLCSLEQRGEYDDEIEFLGGTVYHLDSKKTIFNATIDTWIKLLKFLKIHSGEFNAFHIHTQHAMDGYLDAMIARMAGIPKIIVHSHSTNTLYHPKMHKLFRPLLAKAKITRFACSDEAGKWLYGENGRFSIVKNGIDTNHFHYSEDIRNLVRLENCWSNNKIVGHVGSLAYPKNHLFLLEIFRELIKLDSSVRLVLVGRGEYQQQILKYVSDNGISEYVTLMGVRQNVNELFQGMDIMIFPSRYEGLPVSLIEAQTAALPCLISDVISNEIDLTDYIYRASLNLSATEWAKKAKYILDNNCPRSDTTEKIRVAGYDIETTTNEMYNYYLSN